MRYMDIKSLEDKYIQTKTLKDSGFSYFKINKLVEQNVLRKINNSTYENLLYKGEENDFYNTLAYIPKGVICLLTAARYYNLTNYMPSSIDVAIGRKDRVSTLPDWPDVTIHYFTDVRYSTGIITEEENGLEFRIYDIEKTVVDCVHYRNKVGIEETSEILKNYLKRKDRDLVKLHRLAEKLGCKKILGTYLEVLI